MDKGLPNIDIIENYLQNKMSQADKEKFERELASNPELQEELNFIKDLETGIQFAGRENTINVIQQVQRSLEEEGFFQKKDKSAWVRKIFDRPVLSIAALVVVAAGIFVAYFWIVKPQQSPYGALYAAHFEPETEKLGILLEDLTAPGLINEDKEKNEALANALQAYQKQNFTETQGLLNNYLNQFPGDGVAGFYLGLCRLHLKQYKLAVQTLEPLTGSADSAIKEEISWYLALGYLKMSDEGSHQKGKELFEKLSENPEGKYRQKAQDILQNWQ